MRMIFLRLLVLALLAAFVPACATVGISQRAVLHGTTVVVWNSTDDGAPITVFVDQQLVQRDLPHGERWSHNYAGGFALFYDAGYRNSLVITANVGGVVLEGARVEVYADVYGNSHRTVALYVRGNRRQGYRLEPPRYYAY